MENSESEAVELVKRLEWSGKSALAPFYMGGPTPGYHRSCPVCKGIDPSERWQGEWIESAVGHRRNCTLNKILKGDIK